MSEFAAVVLAGGAARRMGGAAKPARVVAGATLLARVLSAVADADPRIVVGPADLQPLLAPDIIRTCEEPPGGGPIAAIAAGIARLAGTGMCALLAGDLPFLSTEVVGTLRNSLTSADAAVLVDDRGRPQWLAGVWRLASLRDRLAALGDPAGRAMRDLVAGLDVVEVAVPTTTHRPAPAWFDCDTEEDLQRAEELAHGDIG